MDKILIEVRDYELDSQNRVNNAVYLHYLEHARHKWLETKGISFSELNQQDIHLVVYENHIYYKGAVAAADIVEISTAVSKISPLKYVFNQKIFSKNSNNKLVLEAQVIVVATKNNKPILFDLGVN